MKDKRHILGYEFNKDYEGVSNPLLLAELEDLVDVMLLKIYPGVSFPEIMSKPEYKQYVLIVHELFERLPID